MKNNYTFLNNNIYRFENNAVLYSPNVTSNFLYIGIKKDNEKPIFFKTLSNVKDYLYLFHTNNTLDNISVLNRTDYTREGVHHSPAYEIRPFYGGIVSLRKYEYGDDDEAVSTDYDTDDIILSERHNPNTLYSDVRGYCKLSSFYNNKYDEYNGFISNYLTTEFISKNNGGYFKPSFNGLRIVGNCIISGLDSNSTYKIGLTNDNTSTDEGNWQYREEIDHVTQESSDLITINFNNYSPWAFYKYAIGSFYPEVLEIINNLIIDDIKSKLATNNFAKFVILYRYIIKHNNVIEGIYKQNNNYEIIIKIDLEYYKIDYNNNDRYLYAATISLLNYDLVGVEDLVSNLNNNNIENLVSKMRKTISFVESYNYNDDITNHHVSDYDESVTTLGEMLNEIKYDDYLILDIYMYLLYGAGNGKVENQIDSNISNTVDETLVNNIPNNYIKGRIIEAAVNTGIEIEKIEVEEPDWNYIKLNNYINDYNPDTVIKNRIDINEWIVEHISDENEKNKVKSDLTDKYLTHVFNETSKIVSPMFSNPKDVKINVSLLSQDTTVPRTISVCIYDKDNKLKKMDTIILEIFLLYAELVIPNDRNYHGNTLIEDFMEFASGLKEENEPEENKPKVTWKFLGNKIYPLTVDPSIGWEMIGIICAAINLFTNKKDTGIDYYYY